MNHMAVSPDYLERLAESQDAAEKGIADAASEPSDVDYNVWVTHGLICAVSAASISQAMKVRTDAVNNTHAVSTHLAENLRKASVAYQDTDHQAAENLDRQVVS